jgi:amino acid transporter
MKERLSAKITLTFLIIAGIVWLGSINIRTLIGDALVHTGTTEFLPDVETHAERQIYALLTLTSIVVNISYCIVFLSAIVYLITTRLKLKEHGWLMISAILFFFFSPAEFYTIKLDWNFIYAEYFGNAGIPRLRELFIERIAALRGVPVIAALTYYTIVILAIWQPLKKSMPEHN